MAVSMLNSKFKLFEQKFFDSCKYPDKINLLTEAWVTLKDSLKTPLLDSKHVEYANNLVRKSILMLLKAEWQTLNRAMKTHLYTQINSCKDKLKPQSELLASQCESILSIWTDPWGDCTLKQIISSQPYEENDAKEFLEKEQHILKMRLSTLCESKKLFDIAQRLAAIVWKFYDGDAGLSYFNENELHYILDLHLVLLMRHDKRKEIIELMQKLPLGIGLQFIKRLRLYVSNPPDESKVWKKSLKAAEVVALLFTTRAIKGSIKESSNSCLLNELLEQWMDMSSEAVDFLDTITILAANAASADHKFSLAKALHKKFSGKHRLKCIELYISGLITEVNQLEMLQSSENNSEFRAVEAQLSECFLQLANLLSNNINECRECILIAFSLNPTDDSFLLVQEVALRSGKCKTEVLDTGQSSLPSLNEANLDQALLKVEISIEDGSNTMELPQNLKDDLEVVLNCPRSRVLDWQLEWPDFKKKCEEFLKGGRPVAKELKYLDIDYSKFKHLPINEDENHDGIEKGYEIDNDNSTVGDDYEFEEYGPDFTTSSPSDAGSDTSFTMKKKSKILLPLDARRKKSKIQAILKRSCNSSDDNKNKNNHNDSLAMKKVKSPRKPKGKTPKSDSKRNGKSSVVQFQVSNSKTTSKNPLVSDSAMSNTQSNHPSMNYSNFGLSEDLRKILHSSKTPKNPEHLEVLRNFRRKTPLVPDPHSKSNFCNDPRKSSPYPLNVVHGLTSLDMMGPVHQQTTVFQVSPRSSTSTKPDDGVSAPGTSSDQVNGKTNNSTQSNNNFGSSSESSHETPSNLVTPKLVETHHPNTRVAVRPTVQVVSGSAAAQAQFSMTPGLTVIRRDEVQRRALETSQNWNQSSGLPVTTLGSIPSSNEVKLEERTSTTSLPQFNQAFGFGRPDSTSALKQALLASDSKPNSSQPKAAGFGSQTQPAGFGTPAHPPGFGVQQMPPLQQCLPTNPRPSSLQPQPQQLQQQQVQSSPTVGTATQTGIPATTAQVIVKTSGSTAMLTPVATAPTGLLLAPGLTPVGSSSTANLLCITTSHSTLVTGHRSIVMVTSTKAPAAAAQAAGLPTRQSLPALVQRTSNCPPPLEKARVTQVAVQTTSQPKIAPSSLQTLSLPVSRTSSPPGVVVQTSVPSGVTAVGVPALVQTSSSSSAVLPMETTSAVPVPSAKRCKIKASNPILGKYLKQIQALENSDTTSQTPPSTSLSGTSETSSSETPAPGPSTAPSPGTSTPGATAAAAAATAAAAAAAANAPSNVSRPLFPSTPPSENDILKAQLLEFESVLHKVHTTQQAKERQSLTEDDVQPKTTRPVQTDASVQAGPQALSSTAQATTQTVVQASIRNVPKPVIPTSVSVATSCTQTILQSSISLPNSPKKKSKITKTLTVAAAPANISVAPEHRPSVFKPTILHHSIPASKHISQKITEDEETTARILSILRQYDEQLRCSPEINNKPAPRRRNQAQPGSSPNSKRKHKKSKSSVSELSPGTDDTHTNGSEDSSIASHFADGVMEATPTSPLSTCDDRSVTSTATTSGEAVSGSVSTSTTMTSFAGVTKTSVSTTDCGDTSASPSESLSLPNSGTLPKVQILPKVLPAPKVQPHLKIQTLAKTSVFKPQNQTKALTTLKVPSTTKVQPSLKVQTSQKLQEMLKGQTSTKVRLQPKVQPKITQLNTQVTISTAKATTLSVVPSVVTSSQGTSMQSPKDGQNSSLAQVSRVIQSVESLKSAPNQDVVQSELSTASTSSQVSHLARALQSSKQASQTPLLAKALETPAVPLPTSFAGILKRPPKLTITQPGSSAHVVKVNKSILASMEVTSVSTSSQVNQNVATVTSLLQSQPFPQTLTPAPSVQTSQEARMLLPPLIAQQASSSTPVTSSIVAQSPLTQVKQLSEDCNRNEGGQPIQSAECGSSSTTVAIQDVHISTSSTTPPQVQLPVIQPTPKVHSNSPVNSEGQTTDMLVPSQKELPTQDLSPQDRIILSPALQHSSTSTSKCTSPPLSTSPQELISQMHKVSQFIEAESQLQPTTENVSPSLQAQLNIKHLKPVSQAQQSSTQRTSLILQSADQPSLEPAVQLPQTSQLLQSVSQTQLAAQIPHSHPQIIPASQASTQFASQIIHSVSQGDGAPQPLLQANAQILQISTEASPTSQASSIAQIGTAATQVFTSNVVHSVPQIAQPSALIQASPIALTSSQAQSSPQPPLRQLVQSTKSSQTSRQRYGIQPVQLSLSTQASSLRRIVNPPQSVQGECSTHLIQVSQPQLLQSTTQTQQLQASQPLLLPQSPQSISLPPAVTYSGIKPNETDGSKVVSPTRQNLVPLYMVPSSSASQLPVMVPSGGGMVHVVSSQAGNVQVPVVVQVSKQTDGKLTRDDHFVISCDSSQPLVLATSTIQQLLSGNAPIVTAAHLCSALTTPTTATAVVSSAPSYCAVSAVDSSLTSDSTVFSHGSSLVPSETSVVAVPSSLNQIYTTGATPTQVLDAPAASQALPRAVTPSSASNAPPPTNTSPTSTPARPTTLLALQKQQQIQQIAQLQSLRNKQKRQQEDEEKQQKLQTICRRTQLQQQNQQLQPLSTELAQSQHLLAQVVQGIESDIYQQQTPVSGLTQSQLESQATQKPLTRPQLPTRKIRDELNTSASNPVLLSKVARPSLITVTPHYKKTEPTQLKQLLEQSPAPLPPLIRRPSYKSPMSLTPVVTDSSLLTSSPSKEPNDNIKTDTPRDFKPSVVQDDKQIAQSDTKDEKDQQKVSPEKSTTASPALYPMAAPEKLPNEISLVLSSSLSENLPATTLTGNLLQTEKLSCSVVELPPSPSVSSSDKQYPVPPISGNATLSPDKTCTMPSADNLRLSESQEKLPLTVLSESPTSSLYEEILPSSYVSNQFRGLSVSAIPPCTTSPEANSSGSQLLPKLNVSKTPQRYSSKQSPLKSKKPIKMHTPAKQYSKTPVRLPFQYPPKTASKTIQKVGSCLRVREVDSSGVASVTAWVCEESGSPSGGRVFLSGVGTGVSLQSHFKEDDLFSTSEPKQASNQNKECVPVSTTVTAALTETTIKSGQSCFVKSDNVGLEQLSQPSKSSSSGKLSVHQATLQKTVFQGAPPLVFKTVEQSPVDLNVNSRRRSLSPPPEVKPFNATELRVYPPSQGMVDAERAHIIPRAKTPSNLSSAHGSVPLSMLKVAPSKKSSLPNTAAKTQTSMQVPYNAGKSSSTSPKIQSSTEAYAQPLTQTTSPLHITKPISFKAQAVIQPTFQLQTLQSPGMSGQLALTQQAPAPFATTIQQRICTSGSTQRSTSVKVPKRQRNKKRNNSLCQVKDSCCTPISEVPTKPASPSPTSLPQPSSPRRMSSDVELSSSKKSPKKRKECRNDVNPALRSKHMSDSIMRVSLFVENEHCNELSSQMVKDAYYEGQENIPVEVALAALCGEDMEEAKNLIEGNLQGSMNTRGAITLLPADPSENTEELNFSSYRNVIQKNLDVVPDIPGCGGSSVAPLFNACSGREELSVVDRLPKDFLTSSTSDLVQSESKRDVASVVKEETSILPSSDSFSVKVEEESELPHTNDLESSLIKKESSTSSDIKEEDTVSTMVSQKRKPPSHASSFSEQSRSLSGSDDLSMDKTSTSDIFPPETDILLETTLSPSFLGEIAQMSPSSSQDVVSASPEPPERKKRFFMLKTVLTKAQTTVYESPSESVPKFDSELSDKAHPKSEGVNKASSSLDNLNQFNGATMIAEGNIDSAVKQPSPKAVFPYLEVASVEKLSQNLSVDDQVSLRECQVPISGYHTAPQNNLASNSMSESSSVTPCLSTIKAACGSADNSVDEPPWENQPLYVLPSSSDNEDDAFWQSPLTTGVEVSLNREGDADNSSSATSDSLSRSGKGRACSRRSSPSQTRKGSLKRKEDFPNSAGQKRKRLSSYAPLQEDESTVKIRSVLRSSAAKASAPGRKDVNRGDVLSKEETHVSVPRRVSTRTPKPVTKFDEPQKKSKTSIKPSPKTGAHKRK